MQWYGRFARRKKNSNIVQGDEHNPDSNRGAVPSHSVLPMFHAPADPSDAPVMGHVSLDGHAYSCKNPAQMQRSYHM